MSTLATLHDWLSKLEQLHPKEIDLGLSRIAKVFERLALDLPTVITVAGTNGKGSAIAMLEAAFKQLNMSYGSYTSPHILSFNERVKLNSQNVSDALLIEQFNAIESVRAEIPLTYFEYTTLAALMVFAKSNLDVIILEVGLGGRLDAVNIIDADIAIVTSIALDHQDWLGDSLDIIAQEKMGIARKGKPVLICEHKPPSTMQPYADDIGANAFFIQHDFGFSQHEGILEHYLRSGRIIHSPIPRTLSIESFLVALQVLELLDCDIASINLSALAKTALIGRCQYEFIGNKTLLFDVGHNPAAVGRLCAYLEEYHNHQKINVCIGFMADKDYKEIIQLLAPVVNGHWYTIELGIDRALPAATLQQVIVEQAKTKNVSVSTCLDAVDNINDEELLLICGSFYTVALGMQSLKIKGLVCE